MTKTMLSDRSKLIAYHILGWSILLTIDVLSTLIFKQLFRDSLSLVLNFVFSYTVYISFVYLSIGKIVPLIYKRKFSLFILLELLCCLAVISLNWIIDLEFYKWYEFNVMFVFYYMGIFLFHFSLSTAYKVVYDRFKTDKIRKSHLQEEILLLRSQINPHFILNVLNNIIALSRTNANLVEESLLKLSSWIQHMLYNSGQPTVTLTNEVDYIQSYIDLQAQRFNRLSIRSAININNDDLRIEPMLLMPFVENAFKFGMGRFKDPFIDIKIKTEKNTLCFRVQNKYDKQKSQENQYSGIGLKNVEKRLKLLYGDNHTLTITRDNDLFTVDLEIKFAYA